MRTQPDTQTGQIITVVDDSFTFDIYETVYTSDTYYWYKIGFDYNGSYTYGYISGEYTSKDNSYSEDMDFESYLNDIRMGCVSFMQIILNGFLLQIMSEKTGMKLLTMRML